MKLIPPGISDFLIEDLLRNTLHWWKGQGLTRLVGCVSRSSDWYRGTQLKGNWVTKKQICLREGAFCRNGLERASWGLLQTVRSSQHPQRYSCDYRRAHKSMWPWATFTPYYLIVNVNVWTRAWSYDLAPKVQNCFVSALWAMWQWSRSSPDLPTSLRWMTRAKAPNDCKPEDKYGTDSMP